MKKILAACSLLLASSAYAADWTPVFKAFEKSCFGDNKALQAVDKKLIDFKHTKTSAEVVAHKDAKAGNYAHVPLPYRKDMQPAVAKPLAVDEDFYSGYTQVYVGLNNATAYGLPISGYSRYSGADNGVSGRIVHFKPMAAQSFNQLKKIRFQEDEEMGFQGAITRNKKGEVFLICDQST